MADPTLRIADFSGGLNQISPAKVNANEANVLENLIPIEGNLQTWDGFSLHGSGYVNGFGGDVTQLTRFYTGGKAYSLCIDNDNQENGYRPAYVMLDVGSTNTPSWRPIYAADKLYSLTPFQNRVYIGGAGDSMCWDAFYYILGSVACSGNILTGTNTGWLTANIKPGDTISIADPEFEYNQIWNYAAGVVRTVDSDTQITCTATLPTLVGSLPYIVVRTHKMGVDVPAITNGGLISASATTASVPPTWLSNASYVAGNTVIYNSLLYVCTAAQSSTVTPATDTSHWLGVPSIPSSPAAWVAGTAYNVGNFATYNLVPYVCTNAVAAIGTPLVDTTNWTPVSAWVSGTSFNLIPNGYFTSQSYWTGLANAGQTIAVGTSGNPGAISCTSVGSGIVQDRVPGVTPGASYYLQVDATSKFSAFTGTAHMVLTWETSTGAAIGTPVITSELTITTTGVYSLSQFQYTAPSNAAKCKIELIVDTNPGGYAVWFTNIALLPVATTPSYAIGDVVTYSEETYKCTVAVAGGVNPPSTSGAWAYMSTPATWNIASDYYNGAFATYSPSTNAAAVFYQCTGVNGAGPTTPYADNTDWLKLANALTAGEYMYAFTYSNSSVGDESNTSDITNPLTLTVADAVSQISLSGFASLGVTDPQVDTLTIYRTVVNGSIYFQVGSISTIETADTSPWVANHSYMSGDVTASVGDAHPYICTVAVSGSTAPSGDPTHWAQGTFGLFPNTYTDALTDGQLVGNDESPNGNDRPPTDLAMYAYNSRLWGWSQNASTESQNRLYFSTLGEADYWPTFILDPTNVTTYPQNAGGYIDFGSNSSPIRSIIAESSVYNPLYAVGPDLLVLKRGDSAFRLRGYTWADFQSSTAFNVDCLSNSAVAIKGGIAWVSNNGPVILPYGGQDVVRIYEKLYPVNSNPFMGVFWNSPSETGKVVMGAWKDYLLFSCNDTYAFHIPTGAWMHFYNHPEGVGSSGLAQLLTCRSFCWWNGPGDSGELYAGDSAGAIWQLFAETVVPGASSNTSFGPSQPIAWRWKSGMVTSGPTNSNTVIQRHVEEIAVLVRTPSQGTTLTMVIHSNGNMNSPAMSPGIPWVGSQDFPISASGDAWQWLRWNSPADSSPWCFQLELSGEASVPLVIEEIRVRYRSEGKQ
jgi:hypothetical protein